MATWKSKKNGEDKKQSGGSAWNPGNTMETFDYSQWAHDRLKEVLMSYTVPNCDLKVKKVEKVDGTATIIFARGKLRYGYDLSFKCDWKGTVDGKKVSGTMSMDEITSEDDPDSWEFEVTTKKSSSEFKKAARLVKNSKKNLVKLVGEFVEEFKQKKQQ